MRVVTHDDEPARDIYHALAADVTRTASEIMSLLPASPASVPAPPTAATVTSAELVQG